MGEAVSKMVTYQAITQVASPAVFLTTCSMTIKGHCSRKQLPAWLESQRTAALSNARLPTLQPAVEQEANAEDGPLVTGTVSGVEVTFLVDMEANITIVKPSVLYKIKASKHPPLQQVETSMLLANGRSLPFLGRGRFSIRLRREQVMHDV